MTAARSLVLAYFDHHADPYTPVDLGYVKAFIASQAPEIKVDITGIDIAYIEGIPGKNDLFRLRDAATRIAAASEDGSWVVLFLDNNRWTLAFYWEAAQFVSRMIKRARPGLHVGLQSYKVPDAEARRVLGEGGAIDFLVRGEPETPLYELVTGRPPAAITGVACRAPDGAVVLNPEGPLRADLDELPSPFLTGVLDPLLNPDLAALATARGCPFQCEFCHRSVKFSAVRTFSVARVIDELAYLADRGVRRIFVLDDCFVVARARFMALADQYQQRFGDRAGMPRLTVMCRPELLDEEICRRFPQLNVEVCQMGLQTIHPDAQALMGRRCTVSHIEDVARWLQEAGVQVQLDVVIGLPHDTLEHCRATLDLAAKMRPTRLQVKQLYRNSNTMFDLHPERYGLKVEDKRYLYHVPYFSESNTFSNADIRRASEYATSLRYRMVGTRMRLWTQFNQFSDFEEAAFALVKQRWAAQETAPAPPRTAPSAPASGPERT